MAPPAVEHGDHVLGAHLRPSATRWPTPSSPSRVAIPPAADRRDRGRGGLAHRPLQVGSRFSANADAPSRASSEFHDQVDELLLAGPRLGFRQLVSSSTIRFEMRTANGPAAAIWAARPQRLLDRGAVVADPVDEAELVAAGGVDQLAGQRHLHRHVRGGSGAAAGSAPRRPRSARASPPGRRAARRARRRSGRRTARPRARRQRRTPRPRRSSAWPAAARRCRRSRGRRRAGSRRGGTPSGPSPSRSPCRRRSGRRRAAPSSASSRSIAAATPSARAPSTALRASGRFRVTSRTPSRTSVRTASAPRRPRPPSGPPGRAQAAVMSIPVPVMCFPVSEARKTTRSARSPRARSTVPGVCGSLP